MRNISEKSLLSLRKINSTANPVLDRKLGIKGNKYLNQTENVLFAHLTFHIDLVQLFFCNIKSY